MMVSSHVSSDFLDSLSSFPDSIYSYTYLGIHKTPGVCGGAACIEGSRIPIWVLVQYHKLGIDEKELLSAFPTLEERDLKNALNYYRYNQTEIDQQIADNESA